MACLLSKHALLNEMRATCTGQTKLSEKKRRRKKKKKKVKTTHHRATTGAGPYRRRSKSLQSSGRTGERPCAPWSCGSCREKLQQREHKKRNSQHFAHLTQLLERALTPSFSDRLVILFVFLHFAGRYSHCPRRATGFLLSFLARSLSCLFFNRQTGESQVIWPSLCRCHCLCNL